MDTCAGMRRCWFYVIDHSNRVRPHGQSPVRSSAFAVERHGEDHRRGNFKIPWASEGTNTGPCTESYGANAAARGASLSRERGTSVLSCERSRTEELTTLLAHPFSFMFSIYLFFSSVVSAAIYSVFFFIFSFYFSLFLYLLLSHHLKGATLKRTWREQIVISGAGLAN